MPVFPIIQVPADGRIFRRLFLPISHLSYCFEGTCNLLDRHQRSITYLLAKMSLCVHLYDIPDSSVRESRSLRYLGSGRPGSDSIRVISDDDQPRHMLRPKKLLSTTCIEAFASWLPRYHSRIRIGVWKALVSANVSLEVR